MQPKAAMFSTGIALTFYITQIADMAHFFRILVYQFKIWHYEW